MKKNYIAAFAALPVMSFSIVAEDSVVSESEEAIPFVEVRDGQTQYSGIENITVIGNRAYLGAELGGLPLFKLPLASHVVNRQELERLQFVDPDEFLDRIPGESQVRNLRIPQGSKSYTVPLVDGMPLASPYQGATQDITTVNTLDVERIEVIKGPSSALYSNNAFGGVINFVTRDAPENFEGRTWVELGDFNRRRGGVSAVGSVGKFGFFFDANTQNLDGLRDTYKNDRDQLSAKITFSPSEKTKAYIRYEHVERHEVFPGDLRENEFYDDPTVVGATAGSTEKVNSDAVTFKLNHAIGRGSLDIGVVHRVEDSIGDGRFSPPSDSSDQSTFYKIQFDQRFGKSHIVVGGSYFDSTVDNEEYNDDDVALDGTVEVISEENLEIKSLFAQYSLAATEKLTLTAGMRHEDVDLGIFFEQDITEPLNDGQAFGRGFSQTAPKLGISYQLTDTMNVWGNLSWGQLPPSVNNLYLSRPEANPDLNAEKARHVEFGLRGSIGDLLFNTSYYHTRISNFLVTENDGEIETTTNAGQVSVQGVETVLEYSPIDTIKLSLTHAYVKNIYDVFYGADDDGDNDLSGNHISRSPDHHLNTRIAWLPLAGLTIEMEGDFYTGYYTRDDNSIDPEGTFTRGGRLHLRINYNFGSWGLWLHGLNLTDTLADRVSYTPPSSRGAGRRNFRIVDGRTIYGGISYRF